MEKEKKNKLNKIYITKSKIDNVIVWSLIDKSKKSEKIKFETQKEAIDHLHENYDGVIAFVHGRDSKFVFTIKIEDGQREYKLTKRASEEDKEDISKLEIAEEIKEESKDKTKDNQMMIVIWLMVISSLLFIASIIILIVLK